MHSPLKKFAALLALCAASALAQSSGGTITGTVTDQAGAVVAAAMIEAKNADTGAVFPVGSTATGNYVISSLPVGAYDVSAAVPGFKKYIRKGITVGVAQTLGIDIQLEVGQASESVSVTADATLLKTETADVSQNVTVQTLNELPIIGVGSSAAGSSGIRNPNNVTLLVPGTFFQPNSNVKVNGGPTNSQAYRVEGMDASNQAIPYAAAQTQPSVDAIQEVSVQTSNFMPEFGQSGGGFFNVTMRSGGNQYHGSVYNYFVNEVLNAGTPFTIDTPNEHARPRARRNDYGFTVGGPVKLGKLYNGKDKTFFFFGFEQFRETQIINNIPITLPTAAYRNGDFSGAILAAGKTQLKDSTGALVTDAGGLPVYVNSILDPNTARTVGGKFLADVFPNNTIPLGRMDSVALAIQKLIPLPTDPTKALLNDLPVYPSTRHTTIPSLKMDHLINERSRLSFYWSFTHTDSQYSPTFGNSEGLPDPISAARGTFIHSHIERLNYDYTATPTLLFHLGAGYQQNNFFDDAPVLDYNAATSLGLKGATVTRNFPNLIGFCNQAGVTCNAGGGSYNLGPAGQAHNYHQKPSVNGATTWVHQNHSYKFGFDFFALATPTYPFTSTGGTYGFSPNETGLNSGQTFSNGSPGFTYASFLLGLVDNYAIAAPAAFRNFNRELGLYAQDSWKVSRKLTLNYGLRYDLGGYYREEHGRSLNFSPTALNPTTGSLPGAFIFEGSGAGQCNCDFAKTYPFAFGPRVGVAYQITPKTVLRAGWGILYGQTSVQGGGVGTGNPGYNQAGIAAVTSAGSPGQGKAVTTLAQGIPITPVWPDFRAGVLPLLATGNQALPAGVGLLDSSVGRPPRQNQWSIGLEREITGNLVIEASYVANRGVWWPTNLLQDLNAVTPAMLAARGIDINSTTDQALLTSPLSSAAAAARGFRVPYVGFSAANTVAQSLRPFPQFNNIPVIGAPQGKTWYDSLQVKLTKRLSHGLNVGSAFTWQKSLQEGVDTNQNTNIGGAGNPYVNNVVANHDAAKSYSKFDQPFLFVVTASYQVPKWAPGKALGWFTKEWQIGTLLQYGGGLPIPTPAATTALASQLFQPTLMNRVAGQPLYNVDINCHCYDPSSNFVLNKNAWANPLAGQFGGSAEYYGDFRYQRHPSENLNFGRTFRFGRDNRYNVNLRAEFSNIFNRTQIADANLNAVNPLGAITCSIGTVAAGATSCASGVTNGGFGFYNRAVSGTQFAQPRAGTIVARFQF